jgi:hypothetical protein
MRSFKVGLVFLCVALASTAFAAKYREVVLKDGRTFYAEIIGYDEEIYTLNVKDLGIFKIAEWNIEVIHFKTWDEDVEQPVHKKRRMIKPPDNAERELQHMQQYILENPDIMKRILSLPNNPDAQRVLDDPQLMKALYFDDFETLFASPVFIKLLRNPTAQGIVHTEKSNAEKNASGQPSGPKQSHRTQVKSFEAQMLSNATVMQRILSLQSDPAVQKILANPELMQAVQALDIDTLLNSPEFRALFNNETIQEILKEVLE